MALFKRKKESSAKGQTAKKKQGKQQKRSAAAKKRQISSQSRAFAVLKRPLLTEKGTFLGALNKYFFEVDQRATKQEVRKAVEEIYGVRVIKINMIRQLGKARRSGKVAGRTRNWKKALVTLQKGNSIELFKGV